MRRLTVFCGFLALGLAALALGGCGKRGTTRRPASESEPVRPPRIAVDEDPTNPAFPKYSVEDLLSMDYEALSEAQKERLLRVSLDLLRTPDWNAGHRHLVRIGKPAIPGLIAMVGEPKSGEDLIGPVPRVARHSVAEVAQYVLRDMVLNHSDYRGELPQTDAQAWQDWYARHGGSLVIRR